VSFVRDLAWQQLELEERGSISRQIARYALSLDYGAVPDDVRHQVRRCVLDAVGCAIGAYDAPGRSMVDKAFRELGGYDEATLFGSGEKVSVLHAAMQNSLLIRYLDYNDMGGGGHNSDALPSLLAVAERGRKSGMDFATAMVASYEIGGRFRDAVSALPRSEECTVPTHQASRLRPGQVPYTSLEEKGWGSDLRGGLNQPPALGRLMGLDEQQIAHAIGLCLSHTLPLGVLDGHRDECTMGKNIRFGWVAHDAIIACTLARHGFTGPLRVVEAEQGMAAAVARGEIDLERLVDFSGWRMRDVRFKAIPTNGPTASHISATLALVQREGLGPQDIESVKIRCSMRESVHTTSPAKKYPRNGESADHSLFYGNAYAIKHHRFGPEAMDPSHFTDPAILSLIERITVEGDPKLAQYDAVSIITTCGGRTFEMQVHAPKGLGLTGLSDSELEAKFREMVEPRMPRQAADRLIDLCWNVERLDDIGELMRATRVES
jgi:2-methylcitrate dehydratase